MSLKKLNDAQLRAALEASEARTSTGMVGPFLGGDAEQGEYDFQREIRAEMALRETRCSCKEPQQDDFGYYCTHCGGDLRAHKPGDPVPRNEYPGG